MIGGQKMLGKLSKYQKINATPSSESLFTVEHTLGVTPKIVIISCADTDEPYTEEGYIMYFIASDITGVSQYHNLSNHLVVSSSYTYKDSGTLSNGNYRLTTQDIQINRISTNGQWATNTEYTIEIYA